MPDEKKRLPNYGLGWQSGYYIKLSLNPEDLAALQRADRYGNVRVELCKYREPNKDKGGATHYIRVDQWYYDRMNGGVSGREKPQPEQTPKPEEKPEF